MANRARRVLLVGLGVAMLGTLGAWAALETRPDFPVGVVILGAAVLVARGAKIGRAHV